MHNSRAREATIRTPDQRLRVFVSSTLGELAPERSAVARAITGMGLTPVMFELGARPYPPRELYRAYLAQSDIFIGLYWQRYGWVGPDMDISGLEDEFRLSESMPRLLYVKTPAPEREPGLTAMLDEIKARGRESYRSFRSARELSRLVRADLAVLLSERFAAAGDAARDAGDASAEEGDVRERNNSLPMPTTSLIGREEDIAEVVGLLKTPGTRLVTLSGPGGIGKTRLAIAVAHALAATDPVQIYYVTLGSITDRGQAIARIAATLGASLRGARNPLDAVADYIDDSPLLLVLDELERVTDVADDLHELLTRCPQLRILGTSRTLLRIRAERDYPVGPLRLPSAYEVPRVEEIAALPSVQLFVDRARAVRYDFELTEGNAAAVAEICRRLEGVPLAIELAAARTRLLEPEVLLERLSQSLDVLGSGPLDLPERQRTLRATVDWSIGMLSDAEKRMLAVLSIFVDGSSLDAAVSVAGLDETQVLDLLDSLAAHSLLSIDAGAPTPRFGMLESVRSVAAELRAKEPDAEQIAERHARFFRESIEASDWPAQHQNVWADRLAVEEGNIAAAIEWHLDHDFRPLPHVLRILWLLWLLRDQMAQGRAWIERLLPHAEELDDIGRAELMLSWAITAVQVGDDAGALAAMDGIRHLEGRVHDPYIRSASEMAISWVLPIVDDIPGALQAALKAVEGLRAIGDPLLVWATSSVGLFQLTLGETDAAKLTLTETRDLGDKLGNPWLRTFSRALLASLAVQASEMREARAILDEITDPRSAIHLTGEGLTFALVAYARLALGNGEADLAAAALAGVTALRERVGMQAWPSVRRTEAELTERIEKALTPEQLEAARAAGARLTRVEAIALVRGDGLPESAVQPA